MIHHSAGATIQVANKVNYICHPQEDGNDYYQYPGLEVIKRFSCSTQLSTKFQLLIKTKIPTNKEVYCFMSRKCCIYHAQKC